MVRLATIGVMGSGQSRHEGRASRLGGLLAELPVNLLTGGGSGVMASVSRAFAEHPNRQGMVIGVLPCCLDDPLARPQSGYPNPWVEVVIRTHLPHSGPQGRDALSRNHINVLSSDVVVVLPGSHGTASEAALALQYRRPVIAFLEPAEMPGLPSEIETTLDPEAVRRFLLAHLPGS